MHTEYMKLFILMAAFCFANSTTDDAGTTDDDDDDDCKGIKYSCVGPNFDCEGTDSDALTWSCYKGKVNDYHNDDTLCGILAKVNWCGYGLKCSVTWCNEKCKKLNTDYNLNKPCYKSDDDWFTKLFTPHPFDNTVFGHLCVWDNCGTSDDTVKVPCAAGSHCQRKSEWWWQCQENDDRVLYSEAKKESCFTTNNGFYHQDTHGPWGCESDGDCCNSAAKCVNGLCELSCGTE